MEIDIDGWMDDASLSSSQGHNLFFPPLVDNNQIQFGSIKTFSFWLHCNMRFPSMEDNQTQLDALREQSHTIDVIEQTNQRRLV